MKLKIEWNYDTWDCETCGTSFAQGAVVTLGDKVILNEPAVAHCFGSTDIDYIDILKAVCDHFDLEFEEVFYNDDLD